MAITEFAKVMPMIKQDALTQLPGRSLGTGSWAFCNKCRQWFRRRAKTADAFERREAICPDCVAKREQHGAL